MTIKKEDSDFCVGNIFKNSPRKLDGVSRETTHQDNSSFSLDIFLLN